MLVAVLQTALRMLGAAPSRSLAALARRLRVAEAEVTALVVPTTALPTPADLPAPVPVSPLVAMMAPNGASHGPKTRWSRRAVIAARTSATR